MSQATLTTAIAAASSELVVQVAKTPAEIHEVLRLRHQVYCLERGYEPGQDGIETDAYDGHSSHVMLRLAACGTVIGTARLILPRASKRLDSFPMQAVCAAEQFAALPFPDTAEISRFALSKERRGLSTAATSLSRLALVRGLVQLSQQEGVTHWCAVMERTLLRLLRASAIHFEYMGPLVEYHGLRQPAFCDLGAMLRRMAQEQPEIWRYVTANGAFATMAEVVPFGWAERQAA